MKIFKNLFGDHSKISVNEIALSASRLLSDSVIVDEGSNDNGRWIKFSNGIMICTQYTKFTDVAIDDPWGTLYSSAELIPNPYPQPFIQAPYNFPSVDNTGFSLTHFSGDSANKVTKDKPASCYVVAPIAVASTSVGLQSIAFGLWK